MLERISRRLPDGFERLTPLGQAQYLEIMTFLDGYLLHSQGDRMLMGHSVEGRFPFLDFRVAEFAAALPDEMKLRGLEEKYLLRKVAAALLPAEIAGRTKRPYRAPIVSAFVGPRAPDYVREALAPDRLREVGVFQPEAVQRLVRKCEAAGEAGVGETDEMALVGSISVMLLHERFIAHPTLAPAAEPTKTVVGDSVQAAATAAA